MRGRVSALAWLRGYQPTWLRGDLAAGVTTMAVSALAALTGLLFLSHRTAAAGPRSVAAGQRVRHSLRRGSAWSFHSAGTWLLPGRG
jgi:MFS superfamily sulfate permease-like transporter